MTHRLDPLARCFVIAIALGMVALTSACATPPRGQRASSVENALMAHKESFSECFYKHTDHKVPRPVGVVTTFFKIDWTGKVVESRIKSSTLKEPLVEKCILEIINHVHFDSLTEKDGFTEVTYPFRMRAE